MNFVWRDYNPDTMGFVENWLDETAVRLTGLDEGFRAFYEYWMNEDGFAVGENFWCKVVFENNEPFCVIALCMHEHKTTIMEVLIAPDKRGRGKGSALLKELLSCDGIIGSAIEKGDTIIYPNNTPSLKAFENVGFQYFDHRKDDDGESMRYIYERN